MCLQGLCSRGGHAPLLAQIRRRTCRPTANRRERKGGVPVSGSKIRKPGKMKPLRQTDLPPPAISETLWIVIGVSRGFRQEPSQPDLTLTGRQFAQLCHGNSIERALRADAHDASCRCDGTSPLCGSFCSEDPQCGSGDEVALHVAGVVNCSVNAEEALGRSSRLEPLQLALASSDCLMRILCPIILAEPCSCGQARRRRRNAEA